MASYEIMISVSTRSPSGKFRDHRRLHGDQAIGNGLVCIP